MTLSLHFVANYLKIAVIKKLRIGTVYILIKNSGMILSLISLWWKCVDSCFQHPFSKFERSCYFNLNNCTKKQVLCWYWHRAHWLNKVLLTCITSDTRHLQIFTFQRRFFSGIISRSAILNAPFWHTRPCLRETTKWYLTLVFYPVSFPEIWVFISSI